MVFHYTDSEERGVAMRKMIPFAPWQTAYFTRWLGEMSRQGWALKDIKWGRAIFAPAASGGRQYALFPSCVADEEIDELFRRIGDGSLTVPPELERPMPSDLTLPEDPRLAELVGKIGSYQYVQLINQLRREKGWEAVCDWDAFTIMRQTRPDAAQPPELNVDVEAAKKAQAARDTMTARNLALLMVLPIVVLIREITAYNFWLKCAAALLLLWVIYRILLLVRRRIFSEENLGLPYEQYLRRMGRAMAVKNAVEIAAAIAVLVYPILRLLPM